ncbi:MAG: TonB family protein [Candidatus Didemnitutus sp.]|nr:TonB family protein [Candidatus Didemnitutus sp.]
MLRRGVTHGEVQAILKIGPDARLQDTLVTAYTNKAFADAVLAALPQGVFRPRLVDGRPVTTIAAVTVRFEVQGLLVIERFASDDVEFRPGVLAYQPCDPTRLDQPLQTMFAPSPGYPRELRDQAVQGRVELEYYVDESGRVRVPIVTQAGNDTLASLSLAAVERWRFVPPCSQGRPVLVRVRQTFLFQPAAES